MQVVSGNHDIVDDEEVEEVVLVWNEGKKQKAIRDLAMDNTLEDRETLSYYRHVQFYAMPSCIMLTQWQFLSARLHFTLSHKSVVLQDFLSNSVKSSFVVNSTEFLVSFEVCIVRWYAALI